MKNFFVVANRQKAETDNFIKEIEEFLVSKNASCVVDTSCKENERYTDKDVVPEDTECVIVLGGDGTLLHATNDLVDISVPFLGINLGTLGYLSAVEKADTFKALDRMLKDDYIIENRMMLSGIINKDGADIPGIESLNEIVITAEKPMQIVSVSVYINNQFMHRYQGDGVIVSTPTGSTGYNLSAGGPIINPTARTMILTPICPHSMQNRSIVFSSDDTIRIVIDEDRYSGKQNVVAIFDGYHRHLMSTGDDLTISKSGKTTKIVKLNSESFLETLHNKLEG